MPIHNLRADTQALNLSMPNTYPVNNIYLLGKGCLTSVQKALNTFASSHERIHVRFPAVCQTPGNLEADTQ